MPGLTENGFENKSLAEIKTELEEDLVNLLGDAFNVSASQPAGQLIGTFSASLSEVWDLLQVVYSASDPDGATGVPLDNIGKLTGATRLAAKESTATLTATGDPGTVIPAGKLFSVDGSGAQFTNASEEIVGGGGTVSFPVKAVLTGPTVAAAGTITIIDTPISGIDSVTNTLDAVVGRDIETNAAFRLRRSQLLQTTGNGTLNAVRSAVRQVDDVQQVEVFENTSDVIVDGLAPHSIQVVVLGATVDNTQDIFNAIGENKGGGINTNGAEVGTYTDPDGDDFTVKFDTALEIPIYIEADITTDPDTFPIDGEAQIKQAIVDYGNSFAMGDDVHFSKFYAPIYSVSGVENVSSLLVDDVDPPVSTASITIGNKQVATFDTSNIVLNIT